jgi:membrane protease YdiL (CAAX protease family)
MNDPRPRPWPFALFLIGWFVVWALRATVLYRFDRMIEPEWLRGLFSNAVKLALWVLPALAYERWVERAPRVLERWRVTTPVDGRGLVVSGLPCVVFLGLVLADGARRGIDAGRLAPQLAAHAISPLLEELFFRGFVLARVAALVPGARGHVLVALLFVLVHLPFWLAIQAPPAGIPQVAASIFVLALLLGLLVRRGGSIWPAYLVHVANNVIVAL